jgi:DNA-binding MarR family transcriptional regulator
MCWEVTSMWSVDERIVTKVYEVLEEQMKIQDKDKITISHKNIADLAGVSPGTVYKAIKTLEGRNLVRSIPGVSRRFPNSYVLCDGEQYEQEDIKDILTSLTDMIQRLQEENEQLKSLVGGKEIVARTKLPGGLTQVVYRNEESHARAN